MIFITFSRGCKVKEKVFYIMLSLIIPLKTKESNYILTRQNYSRSNFDTINVWDIKQLSADRFIRFIKYWHYEILRQITVMIFSLKQEYFTSISKHMWWFNLGELQVLSIFYSPGRISKVIENALNLLREGILLIKQRVLDFLFWSWGTTHESGLVKLADLWKVGNNCVT